MLWLDFHFYIVKFLLLLLFLFKGKQTSSTVGVARGSFGVKTNSSGKQSNLLDQLIFVAVNVTNVVATLLLLLLLLFVFVYYCFVLERRAFHMVGPQLNLLLFYMMP